MTAAMLAVLLGLGTWQVERLHWKQDVLSQIARAEAAPAVPLPDTPEPYVKVKATGHLRDDLSASYGAEVRDTPAGTQLGTQLIVPLELDDGIAILVDRGWVPDRRPRPLAQAGGDVTIEGYVRPSDTPGMFSATDSPATRQFYTLDAPAIGKALGLERVAPFILVASGRRRRNAIPIRRATCPAHRTTTVLRDHLVWPRRRSRGDLRALGEKGAERMNAYDRLADRFARIATLGEASSVLNWDAATMMPPGGGAARGDQLAVLAGLSHSLLVGAGRRRRSRRRGGRRRDRSMARGQSPADAPRLYPRHGDAARSGRGAGPRQFGLREGMARGTPQVRLRHGAAAPRGGRAPDARGCGGAGAGTRSRSLRRADGRLPAWHAHG